MDTLRYATENAAAIREALEHHRAGRLAEAVQRYQRVLASEPDNADALHLMGNAACQLGDAALAVALIGRASSLVPRNPVYLVSLGMAYRETGAFDAAMDCYRRVLEIDPRSASAHFGIGNTLQAQGRLEEAATHFSTALDANPDFVEARFNLANVEKALGKLPQAIANYRTLVASHPDFADAYHNLGSALHAQGRLDEALESYQRALWRKLPETHNNVGNVYFDLRRFDDALASYRRGVAARPDYPEAFNNIGNTLRELGRDDEALAAYHEAIRLKPDYAVAHHNLGRLLMARERLDEAVECFRQAVAASPRMAEAHFDLGVAQAKRGDQESARACFEQAVALRPGYVEALYNLGAVNGQLSRFEEAERCYRRVLEIDPGHVDAHINLSAILMEDGRTAEAKQHIDFAYSRQSVFEKRSPGAVRTVLILFDAGKGNINLSHLFNEKTNNILDWMIEYAPDGEADRLPRYDLVFNAMGDAEVIGDALGPVRRFIDVCGKPVLNHPDKVALTARDRLPALLDGIDGIMLPPVWKFADIDDWNDAMAAHLPLLVRPAHTHGGVGMVLARTGEELAQIRARQSGTVYVSPFVDYRSAGGWFRKYRIIYIDRKPYPYHLAISPGWMVHYCTAEMEACPWKLAEEQAFLEDPASVLGPGGMRAIEAIGARMDLDYAGVDFSILADGRLLVFEANPTMLAHPEDPSGMLRHKNRYVNRIFEAFEELLRRACRAGGGRSRDPDEMALS